MNESGSEGRLSRSSWYGWVCDLLGGQYTLEIVTHFLLLTLTRQDRISVPRFPDSLTFSKTRLFLIYVMRPPPPSRLCRSNRTEEKPFMLGVFLWGRSFVSWTTATSMSSRFRRRDNSGAFGDRPSAFHWSTLRDLRVRFWASSAEVSTVLPPITFVKSCVVVLQERHVQG